MEFPRQPTPEEQVRYLADINDKLRLENERLRDQVFKYEQTGQALVRDAQKFHADAENLKKALRLRNKQLNLARDKVDELTRHLEKTRAEGASWKKQVLEIKNLNGDIQNRIALHKPIPVRRGPQQGGSSFQGKWI